MAEPEPNDVIPHQQTDSADFADARKNYIRGGDRPALEISSAVTLDYETAAAGADFRNGFG